MLSCIHCREEITKVDSGTVTPCYVHCQTRLVACTGVNATPTEKVMIEVENWLEAARMVAGARMYRDYYTPDLHDDELQEFNLIVGKFQTAMEQLPEPSAETYATFLVKETGPNTK